MENRLPLVRNEDDDECERPSFASSVSRQRSSVVVATDNNVASSSVGPTRDAISSAGTPSYKPTDNVFATPANSVPNSTNASLVDLNVFATPTPSIHRSSLSLSVPRSLSPISVADGAWPHFRDHRRSISLSRSVTPSFSTSSRSSGLHRSDTINTHTTTTSSILYSVPSVTSPPPSPIHSIAPVRPQFDYGGHQQTLSVNGSELGDPDPFDDDFAVPVSDGFAPHTQRQPISSAASDNGSFGSLPPPYTQYPNLTPKPEDGEIDLGVPVRPIITYIDTSVLGGEGNDQQQQQREVGLAGRAVLGGEDTYDGGNENDVCGQTKEWNEKKLLGGRTWIVALAGVVALLVGIAVGLGVGLGIGLRKASNAAHASASPTMTITDQQPTPEQTSSPKSDPNLPYPDIPTGSNIVSPIELKFSNNICDVSVSEDSSTPGYFGLGAMGIWSCNIPEQKPLSWDIDVWPSALANAELSRLKSIPDTLTWEHGNWGAYLISSDEGEDMREKMNTVFVTPNGEKVKYSLPGGYREGMQGPAFYKQPLAFENITYDPGDSTGAERPFTTPFYKFAVLYNKTVVLRETTMIETFNLNGINTSMDGNGSELYEEEKVWMCVWEKTLMEVELMVEVYSISALQKGAHVGHAFDDGSDDSDDEEVPKVTTITVDVSSPRPTGTTPPVPPLSNNFSAPLSQDYIPLVSEPPSPPGPMPTRIFDVPFEFADDFIHLRKRDKAPRSYPQKVIINEYRPTPRRLREVLGIDYTDADDEGQASLGAIRCRKMIVQGDGGMREYNGPGPEEIVEVTLQENPSEVLKRDGDYDPNDQSVATLAQQHGDLCRCSWES